jgi:hypothetical protein
MADAADSKSVGRKAVWVRLPPPAPLFLRRLRNDLETEGSISCGSVKKILVFGATPLLRPAHRKEISL